MPAAEAPSKPTPKRRGGARAGTGPKVVDGVVTSRRQLTLDDATMAAFQALGNGNASLGARRAARLAQGLPADPTPAGA